MRYISVETERSEVNDLIVAQVMREYCTLPQLTETMEYLFNRILSFKSKSILAILAIKTLTCARFCILSSLVFSSWFDGGVQHS